MSTLLGHWRPNWLVLIKVQTIQYGFVYVQLNIKIVLFQTIQFSFSTQFISNFPIDRILSDATFLGQSGSGSNGNESVLRISQSSSITGTSSSDCLVPYPGHSLWEFYPSAKKQSMYSTAPSTVQLSMSKTIP